MKHTEKKPAPIMPRTQSSQLELEQHLQDLRVFVSVAEEKSVTRASEQLNKATSVVTRSILDLEHSLGETLFERKSWGMLLNTYGEAVLIRSRRIQDEIQLAADDILKLAPKSTRTSHAAIINVLFNGRKLALLVQLADLRNFSSVASSMAMTQAGVSMALSRIETVLGQSLFQRRMEGLVASDVAERIVTCARRAFAELRYLSSDLAAISGYATGSVVIGATHMGRTHYMPTAIAAAIAQHPGIRVTCVESPYAQLVRNLRSGDIDMVIGLLRPDGLPDGLIAEPLFTDRLSILARKGHPLAERDQLQLSELLGERWILPRINASAMQQVIDCFGKLGLQPPTPSVETGDLAILRQLLSTSDMLAVGSPNQLSCEIQCGLLIELPVALVGTQLQVGLVQREGAMLSPAALAVINALRAHTRGPQERS